MFAQRYFCNRYFAPRYFAKFGDVITNFGNRGLLLLGVGD